MQAAGTMLMMWIVLCIVVGLGIQIYRTFLSG